VRLLALAALCGLWAVRVSRSRYVVAPPGSFYSDTYSDTY
jgi:hypothetical protein